MLRAPLASRSASAPQHRQVYVSRDPTSVRAPHLPHVLLVYRSSGSSRTQPLRSQTCLRRALNLPWANANRTLLVLALNLEVSFALTLCTLNFGMMIVEYASVR